MQTIKKISKVLLVTFFSLVLAFLQNSEPVLTTDYSYNILTPGSFSTVASSGTNLKTNSNGGQIHFEGWNNSQLRLRFNQDLDLTQYNDLKATLKFTSAGQIKNSQVTLQFFDSSWSGRSNVVVLPISLNAEEKTISISLSQFLNNNFNAKKVKDLNFSALIRGKFSVDLSLANFNLSGSKISVPETTPVLETNPNPEPQPEVTSPVVETPVSEPTPEPIITPEPTTSVCQSFQFYFEEECVSPPDLGGAGAGIARVVSNKVLVYWKTIPQTTKVNLYLAAEPREPSNVSVKMPGEILFATAPITNNFYYLNNLAPTADAFIRVEIITPAGTFNHYLHAKTLGGPRAKLSSQVREVHGYAPNILQVVVADGQGWLGKDASGKDIFDWPKNIGTSLQSGSWTITRADGRAIPVLNKYRHSVPVSANDYADRGFYNDNGFGFYTNFFQIQTDKVTAIDHRIYLVLGENIGSREILKITGPQGISFTLPFSDKYLETPVIQLNQVGYNPRATERYAYISGWLGDGGALKLVNFPTTAQVLLEPTVKNSPKTVAVNNLTITNRANCTTCSVVDPDVAGVEVRQINLASVPASETSYYRVRLPGVGVSWQTEVSEKSVFRTFYVLNRGLFFQRWGGDLQPTLTAWSRPASHTSNIYTGELLEFANGNDTYYLASTPKAGPFKLTGGYYDAGDFDQRPMHTAISQLLLRAFELEPTKYLDKQLNIPESGNGIPDLLDQALWGVRGWEGLQDPLDGGVRMGVQASSHPRGYYLANQDLLTYWTFDKEAKVSARVAGIFAQASRLLAPYDSVRANELKTKAIKAYNYANKNYNSSVAGSLLYGSGELYKLTNDVQYKNKFEYVWSQIDAKAKASFGGNPWNTPFDYTAWSLVPQPAYKTGDYFTPDFFTAYYTTPGANADIKKLMDTKMSAKISGLLNEIQNNHAHRNARPRNYTQDWGASTAVTKFLDPMISYMQMTGESTQSQINALSLSFDYILGGNPSGVVYVTGLGSRRPEEPLHTDSLAFMRLGNKDGVRAPMPGIPTYGPIDGPGGSAYYQPSLNAFYPAYTTQPKSYRFTDTRPFVMSSEFDVWQVQAPLVEAASILLGNRLSPSILLGTDDCGIDHCMDLSRYKR